MIGAVVSRVRRVIEFEVSFAREAYGVWKQLQAIQKMQRDSVTPARIEFYETEEPRGQRRRAA